MLGCERLVAEQLPAAVKEHLVFGRNALQPLDLRLDALHRVAFEVDVQWDSRFVQLDRQVRRLWFRLGFCAFGFRRIHGGRMRRDAGAISFTEGCWLTCGTCVWNGKSVYFRHFRCG